MREVEPARETAPVFLYPTIKEKRTRTPSGIRAAEQLLKLPRSYPVAIKLTNSTTQLLEYLCLYFTNAIFFSSCIPFICKRAK